MQGSRTAVVLGAVLMALSVPASTGALEHDGVSRSQPAPWTRLGAKYPKLDTELSRLAKAAGSRGPTVRVEAVARGARRAELEAAIRAAGGTTGARYGLLVEARIPVGTLEAVAAHPAALRLRRPARPYPQVVGEGVAASGADVWHSAQTRGAGVEIAIVDVGFAGWQALAEDDLPEAQVTTANFCQEVPFDGDDHGTAVAEIVHELAPAAKLHLVCIDTLAALGNAKDYVVANDIPIVNHSVGWLNTSRGDGNGGPTDAIVADARAQGVLWINAAGNYGDTHWSGTFSDPDSDDFHNFEGADEGNDLFLLRGGCAFLKWDDWPGTDQDFDLYLVRSSNGEIAQFSENVQSGLEEPTEEVCADVDDAYYLAIARFSGSGTPRFDLIVAGGEELQHTTPGGSLVEPASSPAALAVGAVCWQSGMLQSYSSRGPTIDGRIKPDVSAPDAVSTATYGPSADCEAGFPGTSASAAHVTGAAALVKQANPSFGPSELQGALEAKTVDLLDAGKDNDSGAGSLALGIPPPEPPDAPANAAVPTISGLFHEGQTLTASDGEWASSAPPFLAFRWLRCGASEGACAPVAGARNRTYVTAAADVGFILKVRVTASNGGGSAQALSAGTPPIQTAIKPPAPSPVILPPAPSPVSPPTVTPPGPPPPVPPRGDARPQPQSRLIALAFSVTPRSPRAGRKFTLILRVATRTVSARGATRRVSCSARIGRKALRPAKSLRGGVARCAWTIPKSAAGKRLKSTIVVSEGAHSVRRSIAARVLGARLG